MSAVEAEGSCLLNTSNNDDIFPVSSEFHQLLEECLSYLSDTPKAGPIDKIPSHAPDPNVSACSACLPQTPTATPAALPPRDPPPFCRPSQPLPQQYNPEPSYAPPRVYSNRYIHPVPTLSYTYYDNKGPVYKPPPPPPPPPPPQLPPQPPPQYGWYDPPTSYIHREPIWYPPPPQREEERVLEQKAERFDWRINGYNSASQAKNNIPAHLDDRSPPSPPIIKRVLNPQKPTCHKKMKLNFMHGLTSVAKVGSSTSAVIHSEEDRVIGKVQRFAGEKWGPECELRLSDLEVEVDEQGSRYWAYNFSRGGRLVFYPEFLPRSDCEEIKNYVFENHMGVLRQYPIQGGMEPRLHGLLDCGPKEHQHSDSATTTTRTYAYHGIKMKALGHVSDSPALERAAHKAATAAAGVGGEASFWNVGCDVICYRNAHDKIGWHADDTQEEDCIFSVIPHAALVRPLHFCPKGSKGKCIRAEECQDGDERLKIYPTAGDAYQMDGEMQKFYVHSLPRVNNSSQEEYGLDKQRRIALIFRHGLEKHTEGPDKGLVPQTLKGTRPTTAEEKHPFGPMREVISEGNIYSRLYLTEVAAFSSQQGGISGTKERGCSAIVVSRQASDLFEADKFETLYYSSTAFQSAGALFKTYILQQNHVRVFRSTALESVYAARDPRAVERKHKQMYRYDGLYQVLDCWVLDEVDVDSWYQPNRFPKGKELYTFTLKRVGAGEKGNLFSTEDLLYDCMERGTIDSNSYEAFHSR